MTDFSQETEANRELIGERVGTKRDIPGDPQVGPRLKEKPTYKDSARKARGRSVELKELVADDRPTLSNREQGLVELGSHRDTDLRLRRLIRDHSAPVPAASDIKPDASLTAEEERHRLNASCYARARSEAKAAGLGEPRSPVTISVLWFLGGCLVAAGVSAIEPRTAWTVLPAGLISGCLAALLCVRKNSNTKKWIRARQNHLIAQVQQLEAGATMDK